MKTRKPNHQRQVKAALSYWQTSMAFLKKERNHEQNQDRRTADDAAACPRRPSEDAGDDEDREGQTHLEPGE